MREHATGEGDRAAVLQVLEADADQIHLPHELAPNAQVEVCIGELRQRSKGSAPGAIHDGLHVSDLGERIPERRDVLEVNLDAAAAPRLPRAARDALG